MKFMKKFHFLVYDELACACFYQHMLMEVTQSQQGKLNYHACQQTIPAWEEG